MVVVHHTWNLFVVEVFGFSTGEKREGGRKGEKEKAEKGEEGERKYLRSFFQNLGSSLKKFLLRNKTWGRENFLENKLLGGGERKGKRKKKKKKKKP